MKDFFNGGRRLFAYLLGGVFTGVVGLNAQAQAEPVKILFVGNSYTHMHNMPGIFEKMAKTAGYNVIVEKSAKSGANFLEHSTRADLFQAIKKRKWDYVILQGYSRELAYDTTTINAETVPYIQSIRDSIMANNPCTQILLYMTWGYDAGYQEKEELNTYYKMADSIANGYKHLGKILDVPIVPVGMIWKNVRKDTYIDLYVEDRAHPSKSGSYLIASTFFNAIFNSSLENVFTNTIDSQNARAIRTIMETYMVENREAFRLNENTYSIVNKSVPLLSVIEFKANYLKATKLTWDFGDGNSSNELSGKHVYKQAGRYLVTLTVEDPCGTRVFQNSIEIKADKSQAVEKKSDVKSAKSRKTTSKTKTTTTAKK